MLGRGALGAPPTPPNFDAQNRAIRPISMRGNVPVICNGRSDVAKSDIVDGVFYGPPKDCA